jgi:ribosome-associated protein
MPERSPSPRKPKPSDPAVVRKFAIDAARLAANTRCQNVIVLDVGGVSPVCDFFVLATGTSPRQMRTVVDELSELGKSMDMPLYGQSGYETENWILADFVDVIVHLFNSESRLYYDLDNLWGDAKPVDWQLESPAKV